MYMNFTKKYPVGRIDFSVGKDLRGAFRAAEFYSFRRWFSFGSDCRVYRCLGPVHGMVKR